LNKVLVVDNDTFFVEFLSEILESRGFHVLKAYDGKEGISMLEQENVDLLFVDMIMPKIDGKQLIRFARSKFPDAGFPIVALSGVILEQLDDLEEIGADYFIAKGPMEKMAKHIESLLDRIEHQQTPIRVDEKIFRSGNLIPTQITGELFQTIKFHRAITESIGIGVLVVDRDAKIITTNSQALDILNLSYEEVLNHQMISVFPKEERANLIGAFKRVLLKPDLKKNSFNLIINSQKIRVIVSLLRIDDKIAGWIIAMEGMGQWVEQA